MKSIPLKGLSKADRTIELWRREKKADARIIRDAAKKKLEWTERAVVLAAREVVKEWATSNLATAVRIMDMALSDYDEARK